MKESERKQMPVLVTGATGYVGGRLVPLLLESGYRIRAMGRSLKKLEARQWADHHNVELVQGDVFDRESLINAARGCWAAFYLVHSMNTRETNFEKADRRAALNMVDAAAKAGLDRIIYLGGLGNEQNPKLSKHLRSRHEVARILQSGPVPTTFLRAAVILGSGSVSFEIMRYLVERLPIMITPSWVKTKNQPIAIRNVLVYLRGCLEADETVGQTFDIGGPDILAYRDLFQIYAEEAGLKKRWIIPVPFLSPVLSSYWIHLVTPVPSAIAMPLAEGLRNEVLCTDNRIQSIIPQKLLSCRETIRLAIDRLNRNQVDTCWSDAGCLLPPEWLYCGDSEFSGGTVLECGYLVRLRATAREVWIPVEKIGGQTGWYYGNFLWQFRGLMDRLAGGIGLKRGRRNSDRVQVGDAIDFWRVVEVKPSERLVLLAEMKIPGEALLDIRIRPIESDLVEMQLLSRFLPKGLFGIVYWYVLFPFHSIVFSGMLRSLARATGKPLIIKPHRFTPVYKKRCDDLPMS
jgi:uncharacterized protein YbjT (DUF2867 family)